MEVDPTMIKPLPMQTTTLLINQFVVQTTLFLNSFSETIEKKISQVSSRVTELEILMSVFEAKLNSVEGMDFDSTALPDTAAAAKPAPPPSAAPSGNLPSVPGAPSTPAVEVASEEAAAPEPAGPMVKDHPDYAKYFKMLKVGVPMPVVAGKMSGEGLDPAYLETPDAPAPGGGSAAAEAGADID